MRDVDSLTFRVRDHPISTNPVTLSAMAASSMLVSTIALVELTRSIYSASLLLASFAKPSQAPASVPRSLDKRPLTAARSSLPVTCLVLPAMSLSPVVCSQGILHPKSALTTAGELVRQQTAAMPYLAVAHHCP
jgi:hypothetical protein